MEAESRKPTDPTVLEILAWVVAIVALIASLSTCGPQPA